MALNSSNESIDGINNPRPDNIDEIRRAVEFVTNEGLKPVGLKNIPGLKKDAGETFLPTPDSLETGAPSLKKRCRLFIQGGQQRGKTLFRRGRRISKRLGGGFIGGRTNRYIMDSTTNNDGGIENSMCLTHAMQSMKHKERVRRSRLAEDALFYEDTFESSHIHGHVEEENPKKSFLQILHKKSKSNKRNKASPFSQSPVAENCMCLKYLNPQNKLNPREEFQINENTLNATQNENGAKPKKRKASKTLRSNGNQSSSETDSLQNVSPIFRPSSVDIGMLLNLSLTDPIVTTFNNNGVPEPKASALTNTKNINVPLALQLDGRFVSSNRAPDPNLPNLNEDPCSSGHHLNTPTIHTQVDFTNFLIPGQKEIIQCPFYWGKIDRYEAEALLADKPEGSFLLRDSAQDDFVFSVSFRRYSRSLHARIEEDRHMFSFDSHDPGVHASHSVRGLLEHYKDPLSCMFFEPMLLFPVVRKTVFSLQSLARASISDRTHYGGISQLPLPKVLKQYLREYHYKHKIRTRYIDTVHDLSR